ncbi:MAG: alpha/beta hydrolase [Deltaproteobacteria bacterium]|nr:alpha/beta hydrolase [Deltaproteobacteria bacterium]
MINLREIDGRKIACWVNNGRFLPDRKTLVFIHGSGGDHTNWLGQYTSMKDRFNIAALDLPGHGRSEGPGERSVAAYVEWVRKIMDGLGISEPVLIGHSLGAAICLSFIIRYNGSAAAAVPVGAGVRMPVNPMILEGLKQDPASVVGMAAKFSIAKQNREKFSKLLAESLLRTDPEILHGDFSACNDLDISEAVAGIRVPTLVVCGAEDKMTPPSLSQAIADRIPGAGLALIEGAGHFVMMENSDAFNSALVDFVNSLP